MQHFFPQGFSLGKCGNLLVGQQTLKDKRIYVPFGMQGVFGPEPISFSLARRVFFEAKKGDTVVDVGCGSGVIAVAAATAGAHSIGLDINQEAVEITNAVAKINKVEIEARHVGPMLEGIKNDSVEIVVSNPPFCESHEQGSMIYAIARKPDPEYLRQAVDGGKDGLEFVRELVIGAFGALKHGGKLIVCIPSLSSEGIMRMVKDTFGHKNVKVGKYVLVPEIWAQGMDEREYATSLYNFLENYRAWETLPAYMLLRITSLMSIVVAEKKRSD